jgi:mRNA interferase MazF
VESHPSENETSAARQGEIWWADLPAPTGSGPGFRRPVAVVQGELNQSRTSTVVCVPLTSNLKWALAPGNVSLSARLTGLPKESVATVSEVISLDKSLLTERAGNCRGPSWSCFFRGWIWFWAGRYLSHQIQVAIHA